VREHDIDIAHEFEWFGDFSLLTFCGCVTSFYYFYIFFAFMEKNVMAYFGK
jgi:hypothetical protein